MAPLQAIPKKPRHPPGFTEDIIVKLAADIRRATVDEPVPGYKLTDISRVQLPIDDAVIAPFRYDVANANLRPVVPEMQKKVGRISEQVCNRPLEIFAPVPAYHQD